MDGTGGFQDINDRTRWRGSVSDTTKETIRLEKTNYIRVNRQKKKQQRKKKIQNGFFRNRSVTGFRKGDTKEGHQSILVQNCNFKN